MSTEDRTERNERLGTMLREQHRTSVRDLEREIGRRMSEEDRDRLLEQIEVGDRASNLLDQDVDFTVLELRRGRILEIERALLRLEEGEYGICEECGEAIDEARLRAIPFTSVCVDCRRREEASRPRTLPTGENFRGGFSDLDDAGDDEAG